MPKILLYLWQISRHTENKDSMARISVVKSRRFDMANVKAEAQRNITLGNIRGP